MKSPDTEDYYAFEGDIAGATVEHVQLVVYVRRNESDNQLYAHRLTGYPHKVSMMYGEWTRLHLPWNKETG